MLDGEHNGIEGVFTGSEWCGATFEPTNENWLFVNIQAPDITFAITGPWRQGAAVTPLAGPGPGEGAR